MADKGCWDETEWRTHLLCNLDLADTTVRTYTQYAVRWVRWALTTGHDPMAPHAVAVRAWSHTLPRGASSRKHAKIAVGHLCAWQRVPDCSSAVARPEKSARRRRLPLSRIDASRLMDHALSLGHEGTAVVVALWTAMRISELRWLHWADFDWQADTIRFFRPKDDGWHTIPFAPELRARLAPERPPDPARAGWMFGKSDGGRRSDQSMRDWLDAVVDGCGLGWVQPHDMRRTAGRATFEASGGDITVPQRLYGHVDPKVTSRYIGVDLDQVRRALGAVDYYTGSRAA